MTDQKPDKMLYFVEVLRDDKPPYRFRQSCTTVRKAWNLIESLTDATFPGENSPLEFSRPDVGTYRVVAISEETARAEMLEKRKHRQISNLVYQTFRKALVIAEKFNDRDENILRELIDSFNRLYSLNK